MRSPVCSWPNCSSSDTLASSAARLSQVSSILSPAGVAWRLSGTKSVSNPPHSDADPEFSTIRRSLVAAFLAGGLLLALELVWFRCLTMYVLSTTLAASVMLAVVLGGIAIGGLLASRWLNQRGESREMLPSIGLLGGAAVVALSTAFESLTSGSQVGDWPRVLWFALVLTGPTAALSGAFLTLLVDRVGRTSMTPAQAVATLTLSNTVGAALGPPVAAFGLLPLLGMERALLFVTILYTLTAGVAAAQIGDRSNRRNRPIVASAAVFVIAVMFFSTDRSPSFNRAVQAYESDGSTIVASREGPAETIFVMQQRWLGQPVYSRLVTNGFSMSGTSIAAMRYMRYFAYWPMLLHQPAVKRALVICYGVGVTVGAVTGHSVARFSGRRGNLS